MCKHSFLELINTILQAHQIANGFVSKNTTYISINKYLHCIEQYQKHLPFVGIINILQADVFFVFKCTIEFRVQSMVIQFVQQKLYVISNKAAITTATVSCNTTSTCFNPCRLSETVLQNLLNTAIRYMFIHTLVT